MTELKHLKSISQLRSNSGIKFLTPAVAPGNHCPMRIASVVVEDIEGLSSLLVGTKECAIHSRLFSPNPEGEKGELHWLYVLDEREVVFGARDGLIDALKQMDQAGAEAILLIATCIPELIGEDIEGIIREIQPELSARVTSVMLGQFKNVSYPPGSWKTMEAMADLMDKKETVTKRINVLGRAPEEDHIPMPSLLPELEKRGFKLRYIAPGATLENIKEASDATLNLVVSPFTKPLAVKMEKEFGIPFISLHTPYDVESIDEAYASIAEKLGFQWENEFEEERQKALELQLELQQKAKGLNYVLAPRIEVPISLAVCLSKLGMEPMLLHIEEYYPGDVEYIKELSALDYNPPVCRMVNSEVDLTMLEQLNPDVCLGELWYTNKKLPCVSDMLDFYGQIGYGRTINLFTRIIDVLNKREQSLKGGNEDGTI